MAKKLKTFITSMGFFDLAVAAPSMKAALEAWGVKRNLFHQGLAAETGDRAIVAAAMAKPGVVLKRPVGTDEAFHEDADLPAGFSLPDVRADLPPARRRGFKKKKSPPVRKTRLPDTAPASVISFEKARARRERARAREEKKARRDREKRASALEKAQARLEAGRNDHQARREKLQRELDRRLEEEDSRWNKERHGLETALDKARRH